MKKLDLPEIDAANKQMLQKMVEAQPMLGVHGHIHESKDVTRIGRTLCVNAGEYGEGILRGCIINIDEKSVKSYFFISS